MPVSSPAILATSEGETHPTGNRKVRSASERVYKVIFKHEWGPETGFILYKKPGFFWLHFSL
jgi:hypothetical protein